MKIGGHGEFWMIGGPILAIVLVGVYATGGTTNLVAAAERLANEGWNAVVVAFRR